MTAANMKPNLAYTVKDPAMLTFPLLVSPKLDGIRCLMIKGAPYSRKMKLIPNSIVQDVFGVMALHGLDGELIVGDPKAADCFNTTTSWVMSKDPPNRADWFFYVFDHFGDEKVDFTMRLSRVKVACKIFPKVTKYVAHKIVNNLEELLEYESQMLLAGFEGVMVRAPEGHYKQGRSTQREGGLGKLKRFVDGEAVIIGFVEQMRNDNEATIGELGQTKRSSHKANKHGKGTLGALQVRDIKSAVEFEIGTGFDDALRADIWSHTKKWWGKVVKYKYQPVGVKTKPRFPVYLGLRMD